MPRRDQRITAIMSFPKKNDALSGMREELPHRVRDLSSRIFHQLRGGDSGGESAFLDGPHFGAGHKHRRAAFGDGSERAGSASFRFRARIRQRYFAIIARAIAS